MTAPTSGLTSELAESDGVERRDLRDYLRVINRRRMTIATTIVVIVAAAVAYSFAQKPTYTASARVLVPEQPATSALQPSSQTQLPAAQSLQRTLLDAQQFAQGSTTKQLADSQLHMSAKVSVQASTTSDVLTFTANSGQRERAALIANTYANAYIAATRQNQVNQFVQQIQALQNSVAKLQQSTASLPPNSSQASAAQASIASLTQSIQGLQAASQVASATGPSVVSPATAPSSPSSPKPVRNALLGLLVGVILGIGFAFLRDRLDDKLDSLEEVRASTGSAPVIGLIPEVSGWHGACHLAIKEDPSSNASEAYRTLRTAVQFLGIDEPRTVIGITSPAPGEGKSTTVANLAISFSRASRRVVVVSGDLRRPSLHAFFNVSSRLGITSVLLGELQLRDVLQEVEDESLLRVLASGPIPPNPAEILSLERFGSLIDTLARGADVVLVDCPPVLPVTDALLISRMTDGMLVVAQAAKTRRRDLHRTYELLRQVKAPILGTVVNSVPQTGSAAHGYYGYGYGYAYSYASENGVGPEPAVAKATIDERGYESEREQAGDSEQVSTDHP